MPLENFRSKLKGYLRRGGYCQKQLAYALEMPPALLSNKLYQRNYTNLIHTEIKQIILTLAKWQLFTTRQEVLELLAEMGLGFNSFSSAEWITPPLCRLGEIETLDYMEEMPLAVGYPQGVNYAGENYLISQNRHTPAPLPFPTKATLPGAKSIPPSMTHPSPRLVKKEPSRLTQSPVVTTDLLLDKEWQNSPLEPGTLYGREVELAWLDQAVKQRKGRLVGLSGLGWMGKTALALKFVQSVKSEFKFVIWYSLWNAPTPETVVTYFLNLLTGSEQPPKKLHLQLIQLLEHLQQARCLLILDQFETVLAAGQHSGAYLGGYEGYRLLLEMLGTQSHQSCLLLTSREKPKEFSILQLSHPQSVFSLTVPGLTPEAGRLLLEESRAGPVFNGSLEEWEQLNRSYSGNPLALKLLAEPLHIVFGGNLGAFLAEKCNVLNDLAELLEQLLARLSKLEQEIVCWLAAEQGVGSLEELKSNFQKRVSGKELVEALVSLGRRNWLEAGSRAGYFELQPLILEYLTERTSVGQVGVSCVLPNSCFPRKFVCQTPPNY